MAKIDIDQLRTTFATYSNEVKTTLDAVGNHLEVGDYKAATETMNTLTQRMAKTSVSMRAILIRGGYIQT